MLDSILNQLNVYTDQALKSQTLEEAMLHLEDAHLLFRKEILRQEKHLVKLEEELSLTKEMLFSAKKTMEKKDQETSSLGIFLGYILSHIEQGVLFINEKGILVSINERARELLGVSLQDVLLKKFWSHFKDDDFGFSLKDALDFDLIQNTSYIQSKNNREIEIQAVLVQKKETQGILIFLKDITEKIQAADKSNHSKNLIDLGEMVRSVAHEIKNPIGGIRGYTMLLEKEIEKPSSKEMVKHITEALKMLDVLLNKILSYAKPTQVKAQTTDLAPFLRKLLKFLHVDPAFPNNIQLELHISEEPFYVPIDTDLIKRALLNLLMNAYQSMSQGGKMIISLMKNNNDCIVTLSDNGVGIEEKDLKNIFSPFFTTKKKGNGIGLSETQKIIEAHFGKIEVRSEIGRGSTFTLTLPLKR